MAIPALCPVLIFMLNLDHSVTLLLRHFLFAPYTGGDLELPEGYRVMIQPTIHLFHWEFSWYHRFRVSHRSQRRYNFFDSGSGGLLMDPCGHTTVEVIRLRVE